MITALFSHRLIRSALAPKNKEKPTRTHIDPHVPHKQVSMLNEIGRGVTSVHDGRRDRRRASVKPGNPRLSVVRWITMVGGIELDKTHCTQLKWGGKEWSGLEWDEIGWNGGKHRFHPSTHPSIHPFTFPFHPSIHPLSFCFQYMCVFVGPLVRVFVGCMPRNNRAFGPHGSTCSS